MTGTALILGGNGRFGRHAAEAFWNTGWRVRLFDRASDNLTDAADSCDVIVNGWNPRYPDWCRELPTQTARVIDAARASGATVIVPGNVYVYGREAPRKLDVKTAHGATNPLGRLRIDMEAAYRSAGIPAILIRAGDFIDTEPSGNWFDRVMAREIGKGRFVYPGDPDVPHAWAYLPDFARATVALARIRHRLDTFAEVPFAGYTLTGRELAHYVGRAAGRSLELRRMSWARVHIARPFWPMAKHLLEMRYLWSMPHRLEPSLIEDLLPGFRETPIVEALGNAIQHEVDPHQSVARSAVPRPRDAAVRHVPVP